jgi:hypothetical protein
MAIPVLPPLPDLPDHAPYIHRGRPESFIVRGFEVFGPYNTMHSFVDIYERSPPGPTPGGGGPPPMPGPPVYPDPVATLEYIIEAAQITEDGWLIHDEDTFDHPAIKHVIRNYGHLVWDDNLIRQFKAKAEQDFIEKHIRYSSGEGALTLDEINAILDTLS